jgi:hypothetical protein
MRPLSIATCALVLSTAPLFADNIVTQGNIEWKTCAEVSTIISDKNVCYVVDTKTKDKKWIIDLCTGANIQGGTIVLGGKFSTMLCATIEIKGAKNKEEAIKEAEKWLAKNLKEKKTCADLAKKIAASKPPTKVAPFELREDEDKGNKLKELRDKAD